MRPRFLLDEHIPRAVQIQLKRREPDIEVVRISEYGVPPRSTLDPDILIWTEENNYLLVTQNRKSMPNHLFDHLAQGRCIPGIISVDDSINIGDFIDLLHIIWGASEMEEYADNINYMTW